MRRFPWLSVILAAALAGCIATDDEDGRDAEASCRVECDDDVTSCRDDCNGDSCILSCDSDYDACVSSCE
jgi:hypothetical protein